MKKLFAFMLVIAIAAAAILLWPILEAAQQQPGGAPSGTVQGGIVINEVMTSNKGAYIDNTGSSSDWVEIFNPTDIAVDLSQFSLTDDETKLDKWGFPKLSLEPGGYAIIFMTGDSKSDIANGILHCSFKLSSAGETLILSNVLGTVDTVDIPALPENVSYGRTGNEWQILSGISPGFENSEAGIAAFQQGRTVTDSPLRINEIMPSNAMTIRDSAGVFSDWVEIVNISDADCDLSGCGLSDNPAKPMKWQFPEGASIKPGETKLIFCSGVSFLSSSDVLEAGFKLSSMGATVVLSDNAGRVLDSVTYGDTDSDWAYARTVASGVPTDNWATTSQPTPGYPNTPDGFTAFIAANPMQTGDIVISEVLASNNKIPLGTAQASSDFIEIENRGSQAVSLAGYGLTDSASNPAKYRFPDVTLQPGQHVAVMAAGLEAAAANAQDLIAPFKLSRLGSTVALFDASDALLDRYFIGEVPQNISVGRETGAAEIAYFETPTPGAANGDGKAGIASAVQFSQTSGKYDGSVQLTLTSADGADIYYTTDGTTPTESSTKYSGPIDVSKTMSVRARAMRADYISSAAATATYFINAGHTLPLVSITTDPKNLFDPTTGIYMEGPNASQVPNEFKAGANFYSDTEVPASFEVYDANGARVFQQDLALRMSGGLTLALRNQKSFAVIARSQYGPSTMQYPFFEDRPYTEYKSLVLRQGGRDNTKIHEYVAFKLVDGKMNVVIQAIKPCVVYVNGDYFGVYYMMEKRNKYMVAAHEGITDSALIDNINLVKGSGRTFVNNGTNKGYIEILDYVTTHDMSVKENHEWLAARLDTDSFMDYMINEIYIANNDPGNMQFYQIPPNGKWIQIYQDVEITWQAFDTVALRLDDATTGSTMFKSLLAYKPWKDAFIERFAWTLKNVYDPDTMIAMIDQAASAIQGEVAAERERWGDTATVEKWESGVQSMRVFAQTRGAALVQYLSSNLSLSQEQINLLKDAVK